MYEGVVKWFGGTNNKTGRRNNFGFISPVSESSQDVFMPASVLSERLKSIFDKSNQGAGFHVLYELEGENAESPSASKVYLLEVLGIVASSNRVPLLSYAEVVGDTSLKGRLIKLSDSLKMPEGSLVHFSIRRKENPEKYIAESPTLLDPSASDAETVKLYSQHLDPRVQRQFLIPWIGLLYEQNESTTCEISALKALNALEREEREKLMNELIVALPSLVLNSPILRKQLQEFQNLYISFLSSYFTEDNPQFLQLFNEVKQILEKLDQANRRQYWEKLEPLRCRAVYRGELWEIMHTDLQTTLIRQRFSQFFSLFEQFSEINYPFSSYTTGEIEDLYKLSKDEMTLVSSWCNGRTDAFEKAKMLSARGAEKLVLAYYSALGRTVEDVSIQQVKYNGNEWKLGDIRIDEKILVDVKNARSAVNSRTYSEFCVPKFKSNRGLNIDIVAVLSPYLQLNYMSGENHIYFSVVNPQILGSFNAKCLKLIESAFAGNCLELDFSRIEEAGNFLAPWLFDYDHYFYEQRNSLLKQFAELTEDCIPKPEDMSFLGNNAYPLFLASSQSFPPQWCAELANWQIEFSKLLLELPVKPITLPFLFLSLLQHFLSMLRDEQNGYEPVLYSSMLFASLDPRKRRPLGIYDPLAIINSFISTLQILWANRNTAEISGFTRFKFNGHGLLLGKRSPQDKCWTTLLAYCGGRIEHKGKCGYEPLVIGRESNCHNCGKLICPKENCGFCSQGCERLNMNSEDDFEF
jgi:cold shock CspA family protein